jgi:ABC-type polysaccharide/polyol phosphate export permease
MRPRFTVLGLLEFTAVVGMILAADRVLLAVGRGYPPVLFGGLILTASIPGAYAGFRLRRENTSEAVIKSARLTSTLVSLGNSVAVLAIMIITAASERTGRGQFGVDWIGITVVIVMLSLVSTGCGMLLALIPAAFVEKGK